MHSWEINLLREIENKPVHFPTFLWKETRDFWLFSVIHLIIHEIVLGSSCWLIAPCTCINSIWLTRNVRLVCLIGSDYQGSCENRELSLIRVRVEQFFNQGEWPSDTRVAMQPIRGISATVYYLSAVIYIMKRSSESEHGWHDIEANAIERICREGVSARFCTFHARVMPDFFILPDSYLLHKDIRQITENPFSPFKISSYVSDT